MNGHVRALLIFAAIAVAVYAGHDWSKPETATATVARQPEETYRLVHAIGNDETILARDLKKYECQREKKERAIIVATMGVGGSVTCLPESLFR